MDSRFFLNCVDAIHVLVSSALILSLTLFITPWLPCGHCKYKWGIEYQNAVRDEETDVAEKLISLEHKTEFRFLIFPDDANR